MSLEQNDGVTVLLNISGSYHNGILQEEFSISKPYEYKTKAYGFVYPLISTVFRRAVTP